MKDLADQLVPRVNTQKSHIKCVAAFHNPVHLYTNKLSSTLNDTIINCLPITVRQPFFQSLIEFKEKNDQNQEASAIFNFISDYISNLAKVYTSYTLEYEDTSPPVRVGVKPVQGSQKTGQNNHTAITSSETPSKKPEFAPHVDSATPYGVAESWSLR